MAKAVQVKINPKILTWARVALGLEPAQLAKKISVKEEKVKEWEAGTSLPSFPQLKKLSNVLRRPSAIFLLNEVPTDPSLPKDFRFIADRKKSSLPTRALEEIRVAQRRHDIAVELAEETGAIVEKNFPKEQFTLRDEPEIVASNLVSHVTNVVGVDFQGIKSEFEYYRIWKKAVEEMGVLVFQESLGDVSQVRGLSLQYEKWPIILINSKDSTRAKTFTLLHELCHLLLNQTGICNVEAPEDRADPNNDIEKFCNAFAAAVLVPKVELLRLVSGVDFSTGIEDKLINSLVKKFLVSHEVIIRRLLTFGKVTLSQYRAKRKELIDNYAKYNKPSFGRSSYAERVVSAHGFNYTDIVLRSLAADKIAPIQVTDFLGAKVRHIKNIEAEIARLKKGSKV